jgi:hypothetical protein
LPGINVGAKSSATRTDVRRRARSARRNTVALRLVNVVGVGVDANDPHGRRGTPPRR